MTAPRAGVSRERGPPLVVRALSFHPDQSRRTPLKRRALFTSTRLTLGSDKWCKLALSERCKKLPIAIESKDQPRDASNARARNLLFALLTDFFFIFLFKFQSRSVFPSLSDHGCESCGTRTRLAKCSAPPAAEQLVTQRR